MPKQELPLHVYGPRTFKPTERAPWEVLLHLGEIDNRAECIAVEIRAVAGSPPITADGIRRVPLGELIHETRTHYAETLDDIIRLASPETASRARARRPAARAQRTRRTPEDLKRVASVYKRAREAGVPVTAAVAAEMHVAENTAPKLIQRARAAGLLPPTRPGVARGGDR